MNLLLLRLVVAVVFIVVETIFFVALHTYFSRPVDQMKNWFIRQNKRTVAILLPILFVTNFGVTFLFSSLITPAPAIPPRPQAGVTRSFAYSVPEQPPITKSPSAPPDMEMVSNSDGLGSAREPIRGFPADDTLR